MKKSFNIQELLHPKSKRHETKPMHPSLSRAFKRQQEHDLKHPALMDLIPTEQNKTNYLPSWIDWELMDEILEDGVLLILVVDFWGRFLSYCPNLQVMPAKLSKFMHVSACRIISHYFCDSKFFAFQAYSLVDFLSYLAYGPQTQKRRKKKKPKKRIN